MRSMTGFGAGVSTLGEAESAKLEVEIRAVNHRYLDLRVRAPEQLPHLAGVIESLARERLTRGRFDVTVRLEGALGALAIDRDRARSVFESLKTLRDELEPGAPVPLSLLGAVPELFVPTLERDPAVMLAALGQAFDRAKASLDEMRDREGATLAEDFRRRLATVRSLGATIAERAPLVVDSYRKRLTERVSQLRASVPGLAVDAARLEQEVVLFADKIDIAEELTRLAAHADHFEATLGEPSQGRRLDFLLQELSREVNTIGSKSQDVVIAHAVVDLKTEIERMREQVQNVE